MPVVEIVDGGGVAEIQVGGTKTFYAAVTVHGLLSRLFWTRTAAQAEATFIGNQTDTIWSALTAPQKHNSKEMTEPRFHKCESPARDVVWLVETSKLSFRAEGFHTRREAEAATYDPDRPTLDI